MHDETTNAPAIAATAAIRSTRLPLERRAGTGKLLFWWGYLIALGAVHVVGLPYYLAPIGERVRSPLHDWFKPSGIVGQTAGIVAFLLFFFMWLYPLRKRLSWLARFGSMKAWLDVHIAAGLMLPLVGAVHAAWRFQGVIGIGFAAMLAVCASGVVGRYLYTHIPRGRDGIELTLAQVHDGRRRLIERIAAETGFDGDGVRTALDAAVRVEPPRGLVGTLVALVTSDFRRWLGVRRLRRVWRSAVDADLERRMLRDVVRLARREISLTQQLGMLEATQRVFRFWHVAHRPFAITAFLAVTIHVAVVVTLGVTWIL